jgi:hypothetical protein
VAQKPLDLMGRWALLFVHFAAGIMSVDGDTTEEIAEASAIEQGIQRDVRPWLNLVDDLSNLTHDSEISIPQVPTIEPNGVQSTHFMRHCFHCVLSS